jgi:transcriptional regulator with XRE-family HTH domain
MPKGVDIDVGARIRLRRRSLAISQTTLANELGVSFQQIQKYELGRNRISASMLARAARVLQTTVSAQLGRYIWRPESSPSSSLARPSFDTLCYTRLSKVAHR